MATRQREVETKYDVDDDTTLPDLAGLPDVARVDGPTTFPLEATYYDTPDLVLGRHGITLRRRAGGADEGWHLKLPVDGDRHEIRVPLGRSEKRPPVALRRIVQEVVRDGVLAPVATLRTERTVHALRDANDALLAELCDDRVVGSHRRGDGVVEEQAWREWELERHDARGKLMRTADKQLRSAGARPARYRSKLGRLLEVEPSLGQGRAIGRRTRSTEHGLLGRHLEDLTDDVHRLDPLARADVPDAVHQLRVAFRRLRSILSTFDKAFDAAVTDRVGDDCSWIGELLGRPRDLEVLRDHLARVVADESPELLRGRIDTWIAGALEVEHRAAHRAARDAMTSERYFALVDTLDSWRQAPPWRDDRDRPTTKRLPGALDRALGRLDRAAKVAAKSTGTDRSRDLHDVRKAAKQARYAAEALSPVLGSKARELARTARTIQTILGDHHDAIVAGDYVLRLADEARAEGRDAFTLGVLHSRLEAEAEAHERAFERAWAKPRQRG
jgi:CHAD domain-containing protein